MKKTFKLLIHPILTIIVSFYCIQPITLRSVKAYSYGYLRVINETTPFFADRLGESFTCFLPYTYYVKVLGESDGYFHVECYGDNQPAIDGYVPSSELFSDGLSVSSPYPNVKITTLNTTPLYSNTDMRESLQYVFKNRELNFYGYAQSSLGENLIYVGYNGKLGYIQESEVFPFSVPDHPNELTFLIPETPKPSPEQTIESESIDLRVIIIGALILACLLAVVVVVKNKPSEKRLEPQYYDENDFE